MASLALFVGLDYSASGVQVCLLDGQRQQVGNRLCGNEWRRRQAGRFTWLIRVTWSG